MEREKKPFVPPDEAACNLIICLKWRQSVAQLHRGLWRCQVSKRKAAFRFECLKRKKFIMVVNVFVKCKTTCLWCSYSDTLRTEILTWCDRRARECSIRLDLFFKTWWLHYPKCNSATEWNHWRIIIRLHAASSGATKGFILLCSHMQTHFKE